MLNDWMFSLYGPTYLGWVVKKYDKDMKMFNKWSTEELIQEVFLQDADPSIIIMWLKKMWAIFMTLLAWDQTLTII